MSSRYCCCCWPANASPNKTLMQDKACTLQTTIFMEQLLLIPVSSVYRSFVLLSNFFLFQVRVVLDVSTQMWAFKLTNKLTHIFCPLLFSRFHLIMILCRLLQPPIWNQQTSTARDRVNLRQENQSALLGWILPCCCWNGLVFTKKTGQKISSSSSPLFYLIAATSH